MAYLLLLIILATLIVPFVVGNMLGNALRMPDHGWKIGVVLLAFSAGLLLCITGWPPNLGIDLSGGVILVYDVGEVEAPAGQEGEQADLDDRNLLEKLVAAVTRRVNPGGVEEVSVRPYGSDQLEIIIPRADENELERMKRIVSQSGSLEFRILANSIDHKATVEKALKSDQRVVRDSEGKIKARWVPVEKGREEDFTRGAVESKIAVRDRPGRYRGEKMLEVLVMHDPYSVSGAHLAKAAPGVDEGGRDNVTFIFDSTGAKLFGALTSDNLPDPTSGFERRLGIIMNEAMFSAPNIKSTIRKHGQISGDFTKAEVREYVDVLNAGSLPAALSEAPVSEMVTGPTLGSDTIRKGTFAILASLILVLVFMLVYYRFCGIVACVAMVLNLIMILGIMILVKADFTLTGIAGLVLTVGMAVDANVLIFERIREELARGAALRMAIRNGFGKATTTIVDANLTTLITAIILYAFATEQIKGFAVVLIIGILTSMFTAIFCSRVIFDIWEKQRWITDLKMRRLVGKTEVDFVGKRYAAGLFSIVVIVIGLIAVVIRGPSLLDIDFTGGTSVCVLFDEPIDVGEVRGDLHGPLDDLTVNYVQLANEERGLRYMINTSNPTPDAVKETLLAVYGDRLASNEMGVTNLKPIEAGKSEKPPKESEPPKEDAKPKENEQTRAGAPYSPRMADPSLLLMAQADAKPPAKDPAEEKDAGKKEAPATAKPATEKPESKPAADKPAADKPAADKPAADKPAEAPPAKPAETPAKKPEADKPAADKPAETPAKPAEAPAKKPAAETPPKEPAPAAPTKDEPAPAAPAEPAPAADAEATDRFAGGTEATLTFAEPVNDKTIETLFKDEFDRPDSVTGPVDFVAYGEGVATGESTPSKKWDVKIALPPEKAKAFFAAISKQLATKPHFPSASAIGGKVAGQMQNRALVAIIAALFCIIAYIWIRFQRVVYGLAAVIALVHDVLVTLGMLAISWYVADFLGFLGIQQFKISLSVLAAFLTIIGYSLNDTIVVFDRIREVKGKSPELTGAMINMSINQTLSRTLLTSLTTLIVVAILYAFGGQGIHAFAFSLVVGVVVGTYSSIFVAAPILYWMSKPVAAAGAALAKNGDSQGKGKGGNK